MAIPLEDTVADVIGKAQRGLGLSDAELAERSEIWPDELESVKRVRGVPLEEVRRLAQVLELDAESLAGLAAGTYYPKVTPPSPGFFAASTDYGNILVNAYLVWDTESGLAAAFDTGADAAPMVAELKRHKLTLQDVYLTHTHVDHVTELDRLIEKAGGSVGVHVNKAEPLGGAAAFQPGVTFALGRLRVETRDTSGHSPGGTTYHIHGLNAPLAIVGDALFAASVGGIRSDYRAALKRIRDNILSAQDNTVLAPGHGPLTTVEQERAHNPFFPDFRQAAAEI
ncbi:MAG TPA: MBL fold metallo-hydrolase [Candidatus Methylacidiphilales bacterium]|nr:MBL fold metallo-hydrolase [Candidatus Methylacidiphilales bacterium]